MAESKQPQSQEAATRQKDESDPHKEALSRYERALQRERDNIDNAYEDLAFLSGTQWPQELLARRELEDRPALTFNELPKFVHQVTGDIRQMKPAIKVVGIDEGSDEETAEVLEGMIRYIENRSDATHIYSAAGDSQVGCGVGAWKVKIDYADDSTYNKELGIELIEDPVSVLFDPDASHPTRRDGMFCFVPVDLTRARYNEMFPDYGSDSIDPVSVKSAPIGWFSEDVIRVAEYWYKVPSKRRLALFSDGSIDDVTGDQEAEQEAIANGATVEERPGFSVEMRWMSGVGFIYPDGEKEEPIRWPGRYIPIIPALGEEIRIGRKRVRKGIVRDAKDPQRLYNFMKTALAESVALQPKAPFLATEKNVRDYEAIWETANTKAHSYLPYHPDPANAGAEPKRVQPPVTSPGLTEAVLMASQDMKSIIGIYDASLGNKSNETSGVAIARRQQEGDTGTFLYIKNFSLAIGHTGRVLLDLIPHVYDTPRTIRIIGEDGKVQTTRINQPQGLEIAGAIEKIKNDVTIGAYDIHMEMGPGYTTKRAEMRDGMQAFIQSAPNASPLVLDLFAKAQDWPMADQIAERLFHLLPPAIQAQEAQKSNDPSKMPPAPPGPPPGEVEKTQAELQKLALEVRGKELENIRREMEIVAKQIEVAQAGPPVDMVKLHAFIGQIDEAMTMLNEHIAGLHAAEMQPPQEPGPADAGPDIDEPSMATPAMTPFTQTGEPPQPTGPMP